MFMFGSRQRGWALRIGGVILLLGALFGAASRAAPPVAAASAPIPASRLRNADGTLRLDGDISGTVDLTGWKVALDSKRGPILTPATDAAPTSRSWQAPPGNGLSCCNVSALAVYGNDLYVGGRFSETWDGSVTNLYNIARFRDNTWHALPHGGLNGGVSAFALFDGALFVGGTFTGTADGARTNFNNIVRFDGQWKQVPHGGLNGTPLTFLVQEGSFVSHLFVGGTFSATADGQVTGLNRVANLLQDHYNRLHWRTFPNQGLNGYYVAALAKYGGDLYAGGSFTASADNAVTGLNYVARLHNRAWEPLANNGLSYQVYALEAFKGSLYAGGSFSSTNDNSVPNLNNIARFDGTSWHALPGNGLDNPVRSFLVNGNDLYVGGDFDKTADQLTPLNTAAMLHAGTWTTLGNNYLGASVYTFALYKNFLYAGGNFESPPVSNAIARLNLTAP